MSEDPGTPTIVVVLSDGTTYSDIDGARIVVLPAGIDPEAIEEALRTDVGYDYNIKQMFESRHPQHTS